MEDEEEKTEGIFERGRTIVLPVTRTLLDASTLASLGHSLLNQSPPSARLSVSPLSCILGSLDETARRRTAWHRHGAGHLSPLALGIVTHRLESGPGEAGDGLGGGR